jgi:hypothetical protein
MTGDAQGIASGASATLFALTFLLGRHLHPLQGILRERRTIVSFGAGVSTAYLFMRMMPELSEAQATLAENVRFGAGDGVIVYLAAMVGFLLVYGLDHFLRPANATPTVPGEAGESGEGELHAYGMVIYVLLLTYVLVNEPAASAAATLQYAVAISFHFVAVDHTLREGMGAFYDRRGRFVLAAACLLGWGLARLVEVPEEALALLVAFVSGGVIMNSAVMELPGERDGRFLPFAAGSLIFGLILIAV